MRGIGVAKDPAQAYAWLAVAASRGDAMAAKTSATRCCTTYLPPVDDGSHAEDLAQQTLASIAAPRRREARDRRRVRLQTTPAHGGPVFPGAAVAGGFLHLGDLAVAS